MKMRPIHRRVMSTATAACLLLAGLAGLAGVAGCGNQSGHDSQYGGANPSSRMHAKDHTGIRNKNINEPRAFTELRRDRDDLMSPRSAGRLRQLNVGADHRNTRMQVNTHLARILEAMDEVKQARVVETDRNVYIAVKLNNGQYGHRVGLHNGRTRYGNDRTDNGLTGTELNFGSYGKQEDISTRLRDKIANRVRFARPGVRHVFVSARPGFMKFLAHPGDVHALNRTVRNMFPTRVSDVLENADMTKFDYEHSPRRQGHDDPQRIHRPTLK